MTAFPLWGGRRNPAAFFGVSGGVSRRLTVKTGKRSACCFLCRVLEMTAFRSMRKSEPF